MQHGHWLVLENIDAAPPEVLAALGQLCDSGVLQIPQRAEAIPAARGFQLLAMLSVTPDGSAGVQDMLGGAWAHVAITPPMPADVACILEHLFEMLVPLLPVALRCCGAVQMAVGGASADQWANTR